MKYFYDVKDVMEMLGVKSGVAYKIIRTLNDELREKGHLVCKGMVSAKYFNERYMIDDNDVEEEGEDKNHERN